MFANANRASGKENGDTDSCTETNLTAGQTLTLGSGRDTTLTGAQARWLSSMRATIAIGHLCQCQPCSGQKNANVGSARALCITGR